MVRDILLWRPLPFVILTIIIVANLGHCHTCSKSHVETRMVPTRLSLEYGYHFCPDGQFGFCYALTTINDPHLEQVTVCDEER